MSPVKIATITAAATFSQLLSQRSRLDALRPSETLVEGEAPELRTDLVEEFAAAWQSALQRALSRHHCGLHSLRVEAGYGYAEHEHDRLRLECDLTALATEAVMAHACLAQPNVAADLETEIEAATWSFLHGNFPPALIASTSCTLTVL